MASHTPGPWTIEWDDEAEGTVSRIVGSDGHAVVIADSGFYPPWGPDALLIARAPEMYDTIVRLRAAFEQYADHLPDCTIHRRTPEQIDKHEWPCSCGLAEVCKREGLAP